MQDCYTCCAEGYVSWREGINEDFVVGIPDVEKIDLVDKLLDKYNFNLGPFSGKNGDPIITIPKRQILHPTHIETEAFGNMIN